MKRFFTNIDALDQYTRSLQVQPSALVCPHCQAHGQFISHGFVYKQYSSSQREAVGKRIFCSNRHAHQGCGGTVQLYLSHCIPQKRYDATSIWTFIAALLLSCSAPIAYQQATGKDNPRQAWRWLRRFYTQLSCWRTAFSQRPTTENPSQPVYYSPQRQCLIETWQSAALTTSSFIADYQYHQQQAFF